MTQMQAIKIERGIKPKPQVQRTKFNFDKMKVGDTIYYEGVRSSVIISFGYRLIRGKYSTKPERGGWRLWLTKDIKHLLLPLERESRYDFDSMDKGSSFHYKGNRYSAIVALGYRLAAGRYKVYHADEFAKKAGGGWVFELTRSIKAVLED